MGWVLAIEEQSPGDNIVQTSFKTEGRKIMISTSGVGNPSSQWDIFKIRGFSYSNARIGEGAPLDASITQYDSLMRPDQCKRDFDAMRKLNANAIKVYVYNVLIEDSWRAHKKCFDHAWNNGFKPIFIDVSLWINGLPMSIAYKNKTLKGYRDMVLDSAQHPALFAYGVGSEFSGDPNCAPSYDVANCTYWQDFDEVVKTIRQAMGSNKKLVTTATYQSACNNPRFCDPVVPDIGHVINGEHAGADVDFWGVDIYSPGPGALYLRKAVFEATTKPFFFPEYGVSYEPTLPGTVKDKSLQEFHLIEDLERYSYAEESGGNEDGGFDPLAPIYSGGLLFEWKDEYWKGPVTNSLPCAASPASAQGWYGKNMVQLKAGCQCSDPDQRSAACALDDLVPRPILRNSSLLPALWSSYIPSRLASSPSFGPPSASSGGNSHVPQSRTCCKADGTECRSCSEVDACECLHVLTPLVI